MRRPEIHFWVRTCPQFVTTNPTFESINVPRLRNAVLDADPDPGKRLDHFLDGGLVWEREHDGRCNNRHSDISMQTCLSQALPGQSASQVVGRKLQLA